jgi:hypothetical protein
MADLDLADFWPNARARRRVSTCVDYDKRSNLMQS